MTREIPAPVQMAIRRLRGNEDARTLLEWVAREHGVGEYGFEEDPRLDAFQNGQRRTVVFLQELIGANESDERSK